MIFSFAVIPHLIFKFYNLCCFPVVYSNTPAECEFGGYVGLMGTSCGGDISGNDCCAITMRNYD